MQLGTLWVPYNLSQSAEAVVPYVASNNPHCRFSLWLTNLPRYDPILPTNHEWPFQELRPRQQSVNTFPPCCDFEFVIVACFYWKKVGQHQGIETKQQAGGTKWGHKWETLCHLSDATKQVACIHQLKGWLRGMMGGSVGRWWWAVDTCLIRDWGKMSASEMTEWLAPGQKKKKRWYD